MDWVCPKSKLPLVFFPRGEDGRDPASAFYLCVGAGLRYRVEGGIPVLLVDEAQAVAPAEVERLVVRARVLGIDLGDKQR
jgi:uncharacterized protein YbaR (Trm112 family)